MYMYPVCGVNNMIHVHVHVHDILCVMYMCANDAYGVCAQ